MEKAYIILAHKNAVQLARLINALNDGMSSFFVHIDRRADASLFGRLIEASVPVEWVPRVKTEWASFGLVEAVLNGLRAVKKSGVIAEQIILLSGQDYPIKGHDDMNDFFQRNGGKIHMEYFSLPAHQKWKPNGGLYRVNKYFMGLKPHQRYAAKTANLFSNLLPFLRRKQYNGMKAFAGSMWWLLNRYAMNYILDFVDRNPRYAAFHRFTFAPDEVFFHMILLNAKDEKISSAIVNDDKRFIKWSGVSSSHPEIITKENFDELRTSDALFARKFDMQKDAEILDLIDHHRLLPKAV